MALHVIEPPKLSNQVGARCHAESPPIPTKDEMGKTKHFTLNCVEIRNHASEQHYAMTKTEKGVTTWVGWTDRDHDDATVEEDL